MMRWLTTLFVFLALTSAASGEELPDIEIPQEDYGLWVPIKSPCSSPLNIVIGKDGITFHNNGETHHFRDVDVNPSYFSGSSGDSIAHAIFPSKEENPAFYLHLFPGEDTNRLVYEILRPQLLPKGLPGSDIRFKRCKK